MDELDDDQNGYISKAEFDEAIQNLLKKLSYGLATSQSW